MKLSPRLMQVAELLAKGYSNKRIGRELHIREQTVEQYTVRLFKLIPGEGNGRIRVALWWSRRNETDAAA